MDEMRKAFETVINEPPYERITARFDENDYNDYSWPGQYRDYTVQLAWEMFKAGVVYGRGREDRHGHGADS